MSFAPAVENRLTESRRFESLQVKDRIRSLVRVSEWGDAMQEDGLALLAKQCHHDTDEPSLSAERPQDCIGEVMTEKAPAPYVWHSDARSVLHVLGITCELAEDEASYLRHLALYTAGDLKARSQLPSKMWVAGGAPSSTTRLKKLPETFVADSYFIVSEKAADVFRKFDLGSSALLPVEMLKRGRKEAFDGQFYLFHITERKEAFEPELSENYRKPRFGDEKWLGVVKPSRTKGDQIKVNASVQQGADVWMDPRLLQSLFFSDPLYQALRSAQVLGNAETIRCEIV